MLSWGQVCLLSSPLLSSAHAIFQFQSFQQRHRKQWIFAWLCCRWSVFFFFLGGGVILLYIRTHLQIIKFLKPPQIHFIFQHILLKLLFFKTCGMAVKHRMFVARSWRSSTLQHHLWITRSVGSLLWKSTWNQRMFKILMEWILWYQEFEIPFWWNEFQLVQKILYMIPLMVAKSGVHQLRLVVYPVIPFFTGFYIHRRWLFGISGPKKQYSHSNQPISRLYIRFWGISIGWSCQDIKLGRFADAHSAKLVTEAAW